jgi:uncharacterized membrane protein
LIPGTLGLIRTLSVSIMFFLRFILMETHSSKGHELLKTDMRGDGVGSVMETGTSGPHRTRLAVTASASIAAGLSAAAVVGGVVLRWHRLGAQSLWFDEGFTALAASYSAANVIRFAQTDSQPPLYYLLQHYWDALFGTSEYAMRSLSAFVGTFSLPVFYFFTKKILKDSMAVALAMWLFAFSVMQLWFSQEARNYEIISFLALVSLYALALFMARRSIALFATIILSVTAGLYMHNMMFFYLLALNVAWLIYPSERSWTQRMKEVSLANVIVGLLYLPWVLSLFSQAARIHRGFWIPKPTATTLFGTLSFIAGFDLDYLAAVTGRVFQLSPYAIWICVVGGVSLLCAAMLAGGLLRVPKVERNKNISLLAYGLLPILAVFVLSQISTPLYGDRIFTSSSVVVPIVFAYPLALQKGRRRRMLYGFLATVLGVLTALSGFGYMRYQRKEDWRDATSSLLRIPESNRLIVFVPSGEEILFDYYAQRSRAMNPGVAKMALPTSYRDGFPPPKARIIADASDIDPLKLAVESRKYSEIDLVLSQGRRGATYDVVLNYLNQVLIRREEQQFQEVKIIRFQEP